MSRKRVSREIDESESQQLKLTPGNLKRVKSDEALDQMDIDNLTSIISKRPIRRSQSIASAQSMASTGSAASKTSGTSNTSTRTADSMQAEFVHLGLGAEYPAYVANAPGMNKTIPGSTKKVTSSQPLRQAKKFPSTKNVTIAGPFGNDVLKKPPLGGKKHYGTRKSRGGASKCVKQTTKKYVNRPSPSFPANKCKGKKKLGNDKTYYVSKKTKSGVYRWTKVAKDTKKKQTTKAKTTRRVKKGGDTAEDSDDETTPGHAAARAGNIDGVVRWLHGADDYTLRLEEQDDMGDTLLSIAIEEGHTDLVILLVNRYNANLENDVNGYTPIELALAVNANPFIIRALEARTR